MSTAAGSANVSPGPTNAQQAPPALPTPLSKGLGNVSPLNNIPPDIATHRALLFALDTPVQLTPAVWERFWPYIDNVWCVHQKPNPSPSTGVAKVYGACRLSRKTNFPQPAIHEHSRPRQRREGGTCKAKFRLTIYPDGRRVVEKTGEEHSHTLDQIDSVKRNSGVRKLVLDDFFKSWEAGGILAFLRDSSKEDQTKDVLKDAGGLYLSRQEVQNILNGALKKAYPGQDVSEVKKQLDKYRNYTTCNYKGCSAPPFPDIKALMDHRKAVHGLKSHDHSDKLYSCPDKTCWRRKKSKGFATLLGLEEHMRDKHATVSQDSPGSTTSRETSILDPPPPQQLTLPLDMTLGNINPLLPAFSNAPITPNSSEEHDQASGMEERNFDLAEKVEGREAIAALTPLEKENMKLRIKRLIIERQKLDSEIGRLNKAVFGNWMGEAALQSVHGE